ncbi:MAG: Hsp33 family molecular chaperone [Pseudomonadota bacterium]
MASNETDETTGGIWQGPADDVVVPFNTQQQGIMGRVARLGPAVDAILKRHDYPLPVAGTLGEALTLTGLLGTALKFGGKLILQTKTDGPLNFLVVNFETPGYLRGYAGFDLEKTQALMKESGTVVDKGKLFGHGHLAMTIDPGGDMDRYQGIVAMEGQSLSAAALTYFRQSEQLPTYIRLAVARHVQPGEVSDAENQSRYKWRAGGLLVQHLPQEGGKPSVGPIEKEDGSLNLHGDQDEAWQRTRILAATVEDHELLDPTLPPDRLLYRLFHEEGVRAYEARPIAERCGCSQQRVTDVISRFDPKQLDELRDDNGDIVVTCEFCSSVYYFEPGAPVASEVASESPNAPETSDAAAESDDATPPRE